MYVDRYTNTVHPALRLFNFDTNLLSPTRKNEQNVTDLRLCNLELIT